MWRITQYMNREAKIKQLLRVVSRKKIIIDVLIGVLALLSIAVNMAEVSEMKGLNFL